MEKLTVQVGKLTGTPLPQTWSYAHTFLSEEKLETRGLLLAVFSFSTTREEVEAVVVGREILLRLQEEYFGEKETPAMRKLTEAVEKVCGEFSNGEQILEICAASLLGNVLYLAIVGAGQAWIKRQNLMGKVLQGEKGKVQNASGLAEEGNLLVLGTGSFFAILSEGVFRAALENEDPQGAVEALAPLVHGSKLAPGSAALVGKFLAKPQLEPEEPELKPSRERPTPSVFFTWEQPQGRKVVFSIALVLIFLLATSLFLGTKKREQAEKEKQFNQIYNQVTDFLGQGEALVELNPRQAKEFFFKAKEEFTELEKLKIETQKTNELKAKVQVALALVVKEYQLTEVPIFTDLTLIQPGAKGDSFWLSGKYLAILDKSQNRLLGLEISRKSGEVLAGGGSLSNPRLLTSFEDSVFVLEDKGIARVKIKTKTVKNPEIKKEENWGEIVFLKAYGGNLYLLDKKKNTLWRYQGGEQGFGPAQSWFAPGVSPDLSSVVSLAINGAVWLLTEQGKIGKFVQGSPVAFALTGLEKPLNSPAVIYTDNEAQNLYVLDKGNNRVVVFAKTGEYRAEYLWPASPQGGEGISGVSDMVVSEGEKKILLLAGSKIYEIGLK